MAEIYNQVSNTLVTGTEDADSITNHGNQVTLAGFGGDDLIDPGADEVVVHYSTGDGNDTVLNVSGNTTLAVSGMYTSMISGTAVVLTVGDGNISLPGAAALGDNLHIQGPLTLPGGNVTNRLPGVVIEGLTTRDSVDNHAARVTMHGNGGNDYLWNEGSEVSIDGGAGNDTIYSGSTQVTVSGGAGNDYLHSRDNYSTIDGGAGNDTIYSGDIENGGENNIIYGGDGDDSIRDLGRDNFIDGGAGNDTIEGNYHGTIQGGTGDDSIFVNHGTVVYALGDGNDTVEDFYTSDDYALSISGGTYSTNISGQDVVVTVGEGKILLKDTASIAPYLNIVGTPESGSANSSLIVGSDNADTIYNSLTGATISALGAEDSVYNEGSNVSISGGTEGDTLYNNSGDNVTMDGDAGNDYLFNRNGDSLVMNGGDGADTIINYNSTYYGRYVTINGGAGNDSIFGGYKSLTTISGGAGNDSVDELAGVYVYNAGDGNDVITSYASSNAIISVVGGTYTSVTSGDDVILNVGTGSIRFVGANVEGQVMPRVVADSTPADTGVSINNTISNTLITGTAYADSITNSGDGVTINALASGDTIINTGASVSISGDAGKDSIRNYGTKGTISAGDGDDYIDNTFLADSVAIDAGAGDDMIYAASSYLTINAGTGDDSIYVQATTSGTTQGGLRNSILGGAGADTIENEGKQTTIDGGAGSDYIDNTELAGNNVIRGGAGADFIYNSAASVTIDAGEDNDYIDNFEGNVTISAGAGADTVYNSYGSSVSISGGDGNDSIHNAPHSDNATITAGAGADTIINRSDSALIDGGAGNDRIQNGDSDDYSPYGVNSTISGGVGSDTISNIRASVSIGGGADNDSIRNTASNVTITGGAGADTVYNVGSNVLIQYTSGDGNDTINDLSTTSTLSIAGAAYTSIQSGNDIVLGVGTGSITLVDAADLSTVNIIGTLSGGGSTDSGTLQGTSGDDSLEIVHEEISWAGGIRQTIYSAIYGLAGDDTLENVNEIYTYDGYTDYKNNVIMDGGTGNDLINNYGANSKLTGGDGNDYIVNHGDNVSISGGSGNDTIDNDGDNVSINAGDGDNSIDNSGTNVTLDALGNGNDSVYNTGNGLTINTGAGNNHVYNSGATLSITAGDGNDTIINDASNVTINAGAGNNSIIAGGSNAIINTGAGNDSINNNSNNSSISTGDGSDTIRNYGYNSSISTGAGNDSIHDSSDNSSISTGAGNDSIDVIGDNVTISGGAGDDYIRNIRGEGDNILIQYASGDGNDSITGFNATSTISIDGAAYTSIQSGSDIVLGVGTGSITLSGAADLSTVNIIGTLSGGSDTQETAVNITNTTSNTVINGSAYNDTITNRASNVTINALGGNDIITNNYTTSPDNVSISGGAGADTIENAGDNSTVLGGAGNDTIENTGNTVQIDAGTGNDSIYSHCEDVTISGAGGNDTIVIGGDNHLVQYSSGDGNDLIQGFKANSSISIGGAAYTSVASGSNIILGVGNGSITLEGAASLSTVNIIGTLDGGDEPGVTLNNTANNTLITGTAYADSIVNSGDDVTIKALAGNDVISLSSADSSNVLINYANGDGNDTVYGFTADDTLSVDSTYKIQVSGNDLIVTVGDGKITLVDAAKLSNPNIESSNQLVQVVEAILKRTAAGYPVIARFVFNPEEITGPEPDNYAAKEAWTITSADNLELYGVHYTPENSNDKWVVLVHGYGLQYESMNPFATFYLANNYNVLMIDQRAAGKSEGTWLTMGVAESQDVALWTQEIARRNSNAKITLHGVSMGAATAMLAAARSDTKNVTSIIEDCGYSDVMATFGVIVANHPELAALGISSELIPLIDPVAESLTGYYLHDAAPIDSISSVKLPSLFISGDDDGVAPVSMLSELYDASGAEVKEKFIVKGAGHAQAGLNDPVGYSNAVFRFVAEADGEGWATENVTDNISLRGTKYNDTLTNSGDGVTISTGAGNDSIENTGDSVSIDAGAGNDSVYSHCEDVTISGAGGNDTIVIGGDNHLVNYASGDGNDYITGFKANSSISIGGAAYSSVQSGDDIILTIGDGKVALTDAATLGTLNVIGTLDGGEGTSINNTASDTVLTGTPYDDTIISNGDRVSIGALGGNDAITFTGQNLTINAGTGNDIIRKGGFGNGKALIEYKAGDGNDYIYYPNSNDTLSIAGAAYSSIESDDDMILVVEDNFITLRGAADRNLNIIGEYTDTVKPGEYIINRLSNTTITGTPLADTVSNYGNYVTIQALASQDSLRNYGNRVSISGNDGDDYIDNYSSLVTIEGDSGNDTINNISGNYVTVWTGAGNDSVNNGGNYVTIRADAGDDTIINSGDNVVFVCYARNGGNDLIQGFKANSTLSIVADVYDSGSFTSVQSGNDIVLTFISGGNTVTLQGAATLSTVNIFGGGEVGISVNNTVNNTLITGTDYADTLTNSGNYVTINAGKDNDTISNGGDNSVIDAGTGNDTVRNGGDNTSIFGGAGNDSIMSDGGGMTITGGKGDDTINSSRFGGVGTTYRYASGDGNDFIQNFENEDTLVVIGSDFTTTRANEAVVVVTVGEGQITLLGAEGTPNIVKESGGGLEIHNTTNNTLITGSDYDDTITNTGTNVTVRGLAGDDYIANVVDSSVTTASLGNSISAGDGNDTIYNYHSYNPTLEGGNGDDSIVVSNGHLTYIDGGNGNDTILGVSESIHSDDWTMGGHATVLGGEGDDYIAPGYSNDSSIDGGTGNDTIRTNGANSTIDGGTGNNLIQITTTEEGVTSQYVVMNGKTTVENFGTGFGSLSDTVLIAGDAPAVDFKSDGLTFYSGDKSLTLSDVTTTARVNMYYAAWDVLTQNVYIADNEWHNVTDLERRTTDNLYYVGATASKNHGLNFNAVTGSLNMTLDTDYTADTDFYVNNVYSIRGGAGNTTITGSAKSDTILAGTGSTTINAGAGGDILSGNGKTTFNIDSGATTAVNGSAGDSLNVSDDSLIFMTDGTAYIVNGRLRRVSDNTVLESAEGDIISGDNVKGATIVDGTSASLTSADRELVIGKNGASLKGYTLDKAFIRNEADAATIIDLINATDSSQLVLDSGTFYTKNQKPIVLEDYDTSNGTFVNIKTADGRKTIFGWSPLNGGLVDGNSIDKPQVIFGDAPNGNSIIRGGALNDSIYAGAKDIVSLSGGHDELHINDETSHGVTVDMGDGSANARTRIVDGFDVTRDLLKIDSPENINARILDGSLQFIKGDSRVTFDELATFDDANGLQVQVDGRTYELRNDYDSGLKDVDYFWTDTDGNYYITDSTFRIFDDGSTREYFIAEGSGRLTIDGFNFGRDKDKLNLTTINGLKTYGDNLYIESGDSDVVEVTGGAGKTIDIKLDGTTYTAQLGKHLTYDLTAEYYGDLHGGTGCAISVAASFAQEAVAIYLNEEEEADGKIRYYGGVTKIDASAFTGRASLVGSEFNDKIIAARGDTSLWGGEAGDDELFGTGSGNSFFYCMGNGDDKIYNAADGDEVNLVDITLDNITNSIISDGAVTLELSDGGRLTVMNSADVTFNLGDGTSWKADRQAREWQQQA